MMRTAIVVTVLADEDRLHRRLHVVLDAALACTLEQRKCPVVGIEHHLLRLARIGTHEQHPAMAEPDMSGLHSHRHAAQKNDFMVRLDPAADHQTAATAPTRRRSDAAGCHVRNTAEVHLDSLAGRAEMSKNEA